MRGSHETRIVVVVVLPAGAEGRRHRKPITDVHGVVIGIVVPASAEPPVMSPIVLDHVHPEREHASAEPDSDRVSPISNKPKEKAAPEDPREPPQDRERPHP